MKAIFTQSKALLKEFLADHPFEKAAALSYVTLLSVGPLILLVIGTVGLVFGRDETSVHLVRQLRDLVGNDGAQVAETILRSASSREGGKISVIIGLILLLVSASAIFVQLQKILNDIWDVKADPKKTAIWTFIRQRLLSFAM